MCGQYCKDNHEGKPVGRNPMRVNPSVMYGGGGVEWCV